jgi:hypothetical protein
MHTTKCVCPVCSHEFERRDAHWEDRRIPERSFGCPACKTFLRHIDNRTTRWGPVVLWTAVVVVGCLGAYFVPPIHELGVMVIDGGKSLDLRVPVLLLVGAFLVTSVARRFTVASGTLVPYADR